MIDLLLYRLWYFVARLGVNNKLMETKSNNRDYIFDGERYCPLFMEVVNMIKIRQNRICYNQYVRSPNSK
jgi:hypothetical protein